MRNFFRTSSVGAVDAAQTLLALGQSQAIIEFNLDGTIITANKAFLDTMGYDLPVIQGKHHSMFVDPKFRESAEYKSFWADLRKGLFRAGEFRRYRKDGKEVWLQASYSPVKGRDGTVCKIVKFAADITDTKLKAADLLGQIEAIGRSQAVIEFELDGTIISANSNFLDAMGYGLKEVAGKHHSIFVDPSDRASNAYRSFWAELAKGNFKSGEFRRIGKDGKEVWIQATYNPILDMNGKPFKVVKFASDVTQEKLRNADFQGQVEAIGKSQAVIEFNLDGTIITANGNFLDAVGYTLEQIKGKHHSLFVLPDEKNSDDYRQLWMSLNQGEFRSGEFRRVGKSGKEIWLQASYNPIRDMNGKPFKVVKYASDITKAVVARKQAEYVQRLMEDTASGAAQLSSSVREISASMEKSRSIVQSAIGKVAEADVLSQRFDGAAKSMVGIVEAITGITGQINMLALNATIEAARAGESGRGFAVVANEVKNLANQARNATEQVETEITGMMDVATEVVGSLAAIRQNMDTVGDYIGSTAAAVEEQNAVTSDMSTNMKKAATEAARMGA